MKYSLRSLIGLGNGLLLGLSLAFYYEYAEKAYFNQISVKYHILQNELKVLEQDLDFLKKNHKLLNNLINKEWLLPQNRLIVGEKINQEARDLNSICLTIEPENTKKMKNNYYFKISKIIIDMNSLLDTYIYDFTKVILKKFPGILILRKFTICRHEEVNHTTLLALRENRRPNFVVGEIVCEWFSMELDKHGEH